MFNGGFLSVYSVQHWCPKR